jgi:hypothetical protein
MGATYNYYWELQGLKEKKLAQTFFHKDTMVWSDWGCTVLVFWCYVELYVSFLVLN